MIESIRAARIERIRYIQAMLGELRVLAEAERCDMLTYMIEMAYIESSDIVRGQRPAQIRPSTISNLKQGNSVG